MADLDALRSAHPDWNLVDVIDNPNGPGTWAVGADGGVFALDGAPYVGSYMELPASDRQGNRTFGLGGIKANKFGGYTLYDPGNTVGYEFRNPAYQPAITNPGGAGTTGPAATPTDDQSGREIFRQFLTEYGLSALADDDSLWNSSKTKAEEEWWIDIKKTTTFRDRFKGLVSLQERAARGEYIPYIPSVKEYVNLEAGYRTEAIKAGLPASFYDSPDDFAKLAENNVSAAEYAERIGTARRAAMSTDPSLRDELSRLLPNVDFGDLTAFFLDPDRATSHLMEKAQLGASARRTGFGILTDQELSDLQGLGKSASQLEAGFGDLALQRGLTQNTIAESLSGDSISREEQLGVVGGDVNAQMELDRRRQSRQAQFGGGGGAASPSRGDTGLGGS